jgi:GTP-binding protein
VTEPVPPGDAAFDAEALEAARVFFAHPVRFLMGAVSMDGLPPPDLPEVAFAGRSNVGKSSLINAVTGRTHLARASTAPGRTRELNFFVADETLRLVDLPGYGFAKRSKDERKAWAELAETYLRTRSTLAAVVVIVDVRRGLEDDDRDLIRFIEETRDVSRRPVTVIVVATKLDKLPRAAQKVALEAVRKGAGRGVIGFSAETGEGKELLWAALRRAALGPEVNS